MKKPLINKLGLLGVVSLLSYTAAVIFAPLAYPSYNWMAQAVSDLSASNAPSKMLWNQLSSLYALCAVVVLTLVCIFVQGKLNKLLRLGIYLFTTMNWISAVGYASFPLSDSGFVGVFQDVMHMVVTATVVLLSISSLLLITIGGLKKKQFVSLGIYAAVCLGLMMFGAIGVGAFPKELFGIPERFSVFAATIFTAILGVYLFRGFEGNQFKAYPSS